VSPQEIFEHWTMGDVERANLTLDILEDVEHLLTPTKS